MGGDLPFYTVHMCIRSYALTPLAAHAESVLPCIDFVPNLVHADLLQYLHAGVNGLEAGQTFIVACAILVHNFLTISSAPDGPLRDGHLFSTYLMLPLAGCTMGLLTHHW